MLQSCRQHLALNRMADQNGDVSPIRNWVISGDFPFDSAQASGNAFMHHNFLEQAGLEENGITPQQFDDLESLLPLTRDTSRVPYFNFISNQKDKKMAVKYLFATIEAPRDTTVYLLMYAAQYLKVWMNGQHIYTGIERQRQRKLYEEYIPVQLRKGSNRLQVKIGVKDLHSSLTHWEFSAAMATEAYARKNFSIEYHSDFVQRSIIDSGRFARIYLGPYSQDASVPYQLKDRKGRMLQTGDLSRMQPDSLNGYRRFIFPETALEQFLVLEVVTGKDTLRQDLFYGRFANFMQQLQNLRSDGLAKFGDVQLERDFAATHERLQRLVGYGLAGENPYVSFWDKSRISVGGELADFCQSLRPGGRADTKFRFGLNSFPSSLDSTIQYYYLHMPVGEKVPLLIMLPFPNENTPLEFSWWISNLDELNKTKWLADQYGFAVMWVDLRGATGTHAISSADLAETFSAASRRFSIDPDRVFVVGSSAGCATALMHAARRPDIFAGCALFGPTMSADTGGLTSLEQRMHPLVVSPNLHNAHVFVQSSEKDEKAPAAQVRQFYDLHFSRFRSSALVMTPEGSHFVSTTERAHDVFRFFADKKRVTSPDTIRFTTFSHLYTGSAWLRIQPATCGAAASVDAHIARDSIFIETRNVWQVAIRLSDLPSAARQFPILLNHQPARIVHSKDTAVVLLDAGVASAHNAHTISEVYSDAFIIVGNDENGALADSLVRHWQNRSWTNCRHIHERDLSPEMLKTHHLIVPGTYSGHSGLKKIPRPENPDRKNTLEITVSPNPYNPAKLLLTVFTDDMARPLPFRDLSLEGGYCYLDYEWAGQQYFHRRRVVAGTAAPRPAN